MVQTVIDADEVSLDSIRYRVEGPITITMPEGFGQKIVIGDYTQENLRRRNTIRWNDLRGGIGLEIVSPQDGNVELTRCFHSECHLFAKGHFTLALDFTSLTGDPSGIHQAIAFFNGQLYLVGTSGAIFRTSTSSDNLTDTSHNLTNTTVDWEAGRLSGTDYIIWGQDGSGYEFASDGATYTTGGREGHFLEIWDQRLWGFDVDDNQLWYTFTPSATAGDHTNDAILPTEIGTALGMFVGPDASGNDILYVLAVDALYAHDASNERFVKTLFQIYSPIKRDATELPRDYHVKPLTWRGSIYIPIGLTVWEYNPTSTPATIRPIGPEGVAHTIPKDITSGYIRSLVGSDQSIYAMVDDSLGEDSAREVVYEWQGHGWQMTYEGISAKELKSARGLVVGAQEMTSTSPYRLWYLVGSFVTKFDLPIDQKNPKQSASWTYSTPNSSNNGRIIFPWIDAGTDSDSIALRLKIDAQDLDSGNEISVGYKLNYVNADTTHSGFTSLISGVNSLDTDGLTEITFPDNGTSTEGLAFRAIQFSIDLTNDSTTTSPDINSIEFEWYRRPTRKLAFDFTLDMTSEYNSFSPMDQFFNLINTIKNSTTLLELTWKDTSQTQNSETRTYYVDVIGFDMIEAGFGSRYDTKVRIHAEEV